MERETQILNENFFNWLKQTGSKAFTAESPEVADLNYYLVRVEKNKSFDYLYYQRQYNNKGICRDDGFEYAGIFCRKDGKLYDWQHGVQNLVDEDVKKRSARKLKENLEAAVRQLIETAVADDRRKLRINGLSDPTWLRRWHDDQCHFAQYRARSRFLENEGLQFPIFQCAYIAKDWTEDSLLLYILDSKEYAAKEAECYWENAQEEMLFCFLSNDAETKEYQALLDDTENPVHTIKKIMMAMKKTDAKTVNVTINKEGKEFTFKTEAWDLRRDCEDYYPIWRIVAADRREFQTRFGKNTYYRPKEIVCITHGKK